MTRVSMWRSLTMVALGMALVASSPGGDGARAASSAATRDTLSMLVDRWAASVGGWPRLGKAGAAHLTARTVTGGIPATIERWVTRTGTRVVTIEGADTSESVVEGGVAWRRDWNGKTLALDGRDRADAVTEAFVLALVHAGWSRATLTAAHARDGGDDSTHARRVVHLAPAGGLACDLVLDKATGRPVRATRRAYDDDATSVFGDWREVGGVAMPFTTVEAGPDGSGDTTAVAAATRMAQAPRFGRPADGPSDVRFASGDRALAIPFNFENDHIMIECRVNGSKPIWFMWDSGANVTIINRARLAEFGLTAFGAATTRGGGGSTGFAYTHVDSLSVGGVTLAGQRDGVIDCAGLERIYGMPMGGLLGYDFASRFTMVVDYTTHTLDLYALGAEPAVARGTRVPFVLEGGHPHVRGEVVVDDAPAIPADFLIDSGAAETANLTAPFVREHHLLERARTTPAGAANVTPGPAQFFTQTSVRGRLRAIRLGGVGVADIPVNLQQGTSGAYASASFSGTIGERILQRFTTTYDYAHSALYLEPNADATKPFPPRTTFGASLMSDGPDYTVFTVSGIRKDSPADSAGFRKGDLLRAFDGKPATQWRLGGLRAALADEGSRHTARVGREGQPDTTLDFTVRTVSIEDR